jgi:hypothetical protein
MALLYRDHEVHHFFKLLQIKTKTGIHIRLKGNREIGYWTRITLFTAKRGIEFVV